MLENKRKERKCLECGKTILYGRMDKVFCSQICKNSYHNKLNQKAKELRRHIVSGLTKNRDVLSTLERNGISKMSLIDIAELGFNPSFFTGMIKLRGKCIYHCFEYSYWMTATYVREIRKNPV